MNLDEITNEVEAVSRIYAERHGIVRSPEWFVLKLQEEVGELTQAFLMKTGQGRAKGKEAVELDVEFRAELADVLAQVLLLGHHYGLDMQRAVEEKWLVWNPEWEGNRRS